MSEGLFDSRCYDLAEVFLDDEPELKAIPAATEQLAQAIQDCIEEWIKDKKE